MKSISKYKQPQHHSTIAPQLFKIALIGPESTGKTTLCKQLVSKYNAQYIPEFAREYIEQLDRPYNYEDLLIIAKEQISKYNRVKTYSTKHIFTDTSLLTMEIWSRDKFGKCDPWIIEQISNETFDLYLLCDIDLPWQYDVQREDANRRQEIFDMHVEYLKKYNFDYKIISGLGNKRLENAVKTIEAI